MSSTVLNDANFIFRRAQEQVNVLATQPQFLAKFHPDQVTDTIYTARQLRNTLNDLLTELEYYRK